MKEFLKHVPSVWDDTRFLAGEPGKYVVLARKATGASTLPASTRRRRSRRSRSISPPGMKGGGMLITDGKDEPFAQQAVKPGGDGRLTLTMKPLGGFVMTVP